MAAIINEPKESATASLSAADQQLKAQLLGVSPTPAFLTPFFNLAFRPYFLGGALLAIIAIGLWMLALQGFVSFKPVLPLLLWHPHEMIFGFGGTIAVGFLLTAAQTWTGQKSITGKWLCAMFILWLVVRIAISGVVPNMMFEAIVAGQVIWWLIAIVGFGRMIVLSNNKRNAIFMPILVAMMLLNVAYLWLAAQQEIGVALHVSRTAIFLFVVLITIIGGRVIPFFTHLGLPDKPVMTPTPLLDKALTGGTGLLVGLYLSSHWVVFPHAVAAGMFVCGSLLLVRQCYWRAMQTLQVPLLWSLHLANICVGVGVLCVSATFYTTITLSSALHVITVGGMGGMILSMIARVSLGHTGRPLKVGKWMQTAFVCLFLAALARVLLPMLGVVMPGLWVSAGLWALSFIIFVIIYAPILLTARVDGKLG